MSFMRVNIESYKNAPLLLVYRADKNLSVNLA